MNSLRNITQYGFISSIRRIMCRTMIQRASGRKCESCFQTFLIDHSSGAGLQSLAYIDHFHPRSNPRFHPFSGLPMGFSTTTKITIHFFIADFKGFLFFSAKSLGGCLVVGNDSMRQLFTLWIILIGE